MLNVTFYNEQNGKFNVAENKFDISSLKNGANVFGANTTLLSFNSDLSSLTNGYHMFDSCKNLTSFTSDLSSLTNGTEMFYGCQNLTSFTSDLSSLTDGSEMFRGCSHLTSFPSDLSSLVDGYGMFYGTRFTSFSSDLSSLVNGNQMFRDCSHLTSFDADLSSLTSGYYMFDSCENLTVFESILLSLESGTNMFYQCKLNPTSIYYIVKSLPNNGKSCNITLGIGVSSATTNDGKDTATQLLEFANEVGYNTWDDLKAAFTAKNWNATWQYGGTTTNITLSEDEQFRGVPVYARLIEEEDKDIAEYCTEDGTKYYNIDWGHDVCDATNYQYFGSLLEACGYYGVIPKQFLETE